MKSTLCLRHGALVAAFATLASPLAHAQEVGATLDAHTQALTALQARVRELEAQRPAAPEDPARSPYLDVREAPFSVGDFTWMNGSNYQPSSLLHLGPVTASFMVDTFYAWQFWHPIDHTTFLSTTAPRHNEIGNNLAYLGLELNGIDTPAGGPIGRLEIQFGANTETDAGQDATTTRGSYLTLRAMQYLKQAAAGWHFHWLHGVNVEVGVFPSFVGLDSYVPQENWSYTHPYVSDFTPYYFAGARVQIYPSQQSRIELWLVNGWQTFGHWHDALAGGYTLHWRPSENVALMHLAYVGKEQASDPDALRVYSDSWVQLRVWHNLSRAFFQSVAFSLAADLGYELRGPAMTGRPPSGVMTGASLSARVEWTRHFMTTLRGDMYYDQSAAVVSALPLGNPYSVPGNGRADNPYAWLGAGFTATMDWRPSPWLLVRLEYAHRNANQPYFSGPGGITGPNGSPPANDAERASFRPDLRDSDDRVIANMTLRL